MHHQSPERLDDPPIIPSKLILFPITFTKTFSHTSKIVKTLRQLVPSINFIFGENIIMAGNEIDLSNTYVFRRI